MFNLLLSFLMGATPTPWFYSGSYASRVACETAAVNLHLSRKEIETYWVCIDTRTGQIVEPIPR